MGRKEKSIPGKKEPYTERRRVCSRNQRDMCRWHKEKQEPGMLRHTKVSNQHIIYLKLPQCYISIFFKKGDIKKERKKQQKEQQNTCGFRGDDSQTLLGFVVLRFNIIFRDTGSCLNFLSIILGSSCQ